MYVYNIDWLKEKFSDSDTSFFYFTTKSLLLSEIISPSLIQNICNFYDLNAKDIANGKNDFCQFFSQWLILSVSRIYILITRKNNSNSGLKHNVQTNLENQVIIQYILRILLL